MNLHQDPVLALVVVQQQHRDLRSEAQRGHAANVAESANMASKRWTWTQLKALAASMHRIGAPAIRRQMG